MTHLVLCQDCLRVLPYSDELHQTPNSCTCGGDMCGCDDCNHTAQKIQAKEVDYVVCAFFNDNLPARYFMEFDRLGRVLLTFDSSCAYLFADQAGAEILADRVHSSLLSSHEPKPDSVTVYVTFLIRGDK